MHSVYPEEPGSLSMEGKSTKVRRFRLWQPPLAPMNNDRSPDWRPISSDILERCDWIFAEGFEALYASWSGACGCPLSNISDEDVDLRPTEVFRKLDRYIFLQQDGPVQGGHDTLPTEDLAIEVALRNAIRAYAARWLESDAQRPQYELQIASLWRIARADMLKVLNRLCYRSILTLHLFGQTPVPEGITGTEKCDGVGATVCGQMALTQLQQLRSQAHSSIVGNAVHDQTSLGTYLNLETRAYWLAIMWDVSAAMNLDIRSSLTSSLKGACSEPTWCIVRSYLMSDALAPKAHEKEGGLMSPHKILAFANVGRLYLWKNITSVKEGLREGVDEHSLLQCWTALIDALNIWQDRIRPWLLGLESHETSLSSSNRMGLVDVTAHFCIGIFALIDALQVSGREDLSQQLPGTRAEAESKAFSLWEGTVGRRQPVRVSPTSSKSAFGHGWVFMDSSYPDMMVALGKPVDRKVQQSQQNRALTEEVRAA